MGKFFEIDGYWTDTKDTFEGLIVHDYDDCPEHVDDSEIFYFGLGEHAIKEAIQVGESIGDFVITDYRPYTLFDKEQE